jgi:NAD(P)-dependent dehydrogenase (short-subunit alcohol dehydrogenase family)
MALTALVTGGSRGLGRGCAIGLGESGATVWVTGRTREDGAGPVPLTGSVRSTVAAVDAAGGRGIARACDHTDDDAVRALFEELPPLDVLVNGVWGGYERFVGVGELSFGPFWEQPLSLWDDMERGVRSAYVASSLAARRMVERGRGLIVCISSAAAERFVAPVAYGVAHASIDRLVADMAVELGGTGVVAVALHPGLVRTENVLANAQHFDLSDSESPELAGRIVAALAADPEAARYNGSALEIQELAERYAIRDT